MKLPRRFAAALDPNDQLRIDESFASFEHWQAWEAAHADLLQANAGDVVADRILKNGFVEPLTGRSVAPAEIDATNRNWREGLEANGLNARIRAVLLLMAAQLQLFNPHFVRIYAPEAITPFALLLRGRFAKFLGSEYAVNQDAADAIFPIQHQDLTALTLPSNAFDVVTTNEVLEHVPDIDLALREIARVLKPGGWHIGTHPFYYFQREGDVRARLVDGAVVHIKEPEFHENPIDPAGGSLVFEKPGWDIMERARAAGFSNPVMRFIASEAHGIATANTGVFVLCAQK